MSESIIAIQGLDKRYGDVHALRAVDVQMPLGAVGLLGPNGAGKTTLLKLLLGLLRPTAGSATIAGHSALSRKGRQAIRRVVGYMPESDCLLPGMTGIELVSTLGRVSGLRREDAITRAHEVLDYVELEEARYRSLGQYSTGMKQRLKLAQALVHDPLVLLLDEPTNGLDPKGRRHMLSLVEDLGRNQGKNVLLCSHLLRDVERTCDNVVVLNDGRVVQQGSVAELTGPQGAVLRVSLDAEAPGFAGALADRGWDALQDAEGCWSINTPPELPDADEVFAAAAACGAVITGLEHQRSSLEEVFLRALAADQANSARSDR